MKKKILMLQVVSSAFGITVCSLYDAEAMRALKPRPVVMRNIDPENTNLARPPSTSVNGAPLAAQSGPGTQQNRPGDIASNRGGAQIGPGSRPQSNQSTSGQCPLSQVSPSSQPPQIGGQRPPASPPTSSRVEQIQSSLTSPKGPSPKGPSPKGPSPKGPSPKGPSAQGPSAQGPSPQGAATQSHVTFSDSESSDSSEAFEAQYSDLMKIAEANGFDRSNGALDVWLADRILENDILKGAIVRCTGKADIVLTVMTRAMTRQRPYLTSDSLNVLNELAMNRTQEFSDALNRRLLPSSIPDRCIEDFFGCDVSNASDGQFTGILYSYGPAFLQAYSPEIVLADGRAAALVSKLMECLEARYQGWKKDGSVKKKFGEGYCLILNAIVEFVRLARGANKAANIDWVVAHPGLAPLVYLCNETGQGPALLGFLKAHFNWPYGGWATFGNGGGCFNNVNGVLVYNGNYVNAKDYENFVDGRNITFKLSDKHINRTGKNQVLDTAIFNSIDPSIIERLPQVTAK